MFAPHRRLVFVLMLVCGVAFAQDVSNLPELPLDVVGCPHEYEVELPISLRIEINALNQERGYAPSPALQKIAVTCSEPAHVHIDVVLVQGQSASLDLDQTLVAPEARTRALALSAVELVDELCTRVPAPKQASTPTRQRPSTDVPAPAPPVRAHAARTLSLGPLVERVGRPGAWLFGGELELAWSLGRFVTPIVQLRGQGGRGGGDTTPVRISSFSGAAFVMLGAGSARWWCGVGPGARAGVASLSGDASNNARLQGYTLTAPWGGFGIRAAVNHTSAAVPLRFSLGADLGIIALRAAGTLDDGARVYALDGAWVGVTLLTGLDF